MSRAPDPNMGPSASWPSWLGHLPPVVPHDALTTCLGYFTDSHVRLQATRGEAARTRANFCAFSTHALRIACESVRIRANPCEDSGRSVRIACESVRIRANPSRTRAHARASARAGGPRERAGAQPWTCGTTPAREPRSSIDRANPCESGANPARTGGDGVRIRRESVRICRDFRANPCEFLVNARERARTRETHCARLRP